MKIEQAIMELQKYLDMDSLQLPEMNFHDLIITNHPCYSVDERNEIIALNLSNLSLAKLPECVTSFESLLALRLHGNNLSILPPSFNNLMNLTHLYLPVNKFDFFPKEIIQIKSLQVLAINQNMIKHVPPELGDLKELQRLGLSGNKLSVLPYSISMLHNLQSLFIENNEFANLPDWLTKLTNLEQLSISRNPVEKLPNDFDKLSNLCLLSLRETKLTELPLSVYQLSNLEELDLNGVPITEISYHIKMLKKLKRIDLNGTQINSLPKEFSELKEMLYLNLSSLKLQEIPPVIFNLFNLQELNLSGTRIHSIPSEIGRLNNLDHLDLSGMGLTSIPPAIFNLNKLHRLNLVGNRIRELPPQIVQANIDICWSTHGRENGIFLHRNPLESPPPEIVIKGTGAVKSYFMSFKGEKKPIDEVKVLLVGDGDAGKTSIVKRLTGGEFSENEPQTHGININDFNINSGGKRIKVHFWDFGGQEIMHATHQFFLSKRSAYILVLDGRKDEKTEYWLKHIETFGGDSPIIIVMNKIDQHLSFDVNRKFLSEKYPSIKGFYRVSCLNNTGLKELQGALSRTLARIEHTKTLWAYAWFNVKERMEMMTEDFISYTRYREICKTEGINDIDSQDTLVEFLHDLGVVLSFKDLALRDTNVINPRWVTNGVYKIINCEKIAYAGGELHLNLLNDILDKKTHPPEKHDFIIELMKKFELCYELNGEKVLIPSLLPIEEPNYSFDIDDFIRFYIDYDFFPKSILPRFIVKMHDDIHNQLRWRTGVVLKNKHINCHAVVKADEIEKRISILILGSQKRDYLGIILYSFRLINQSFKKLKYTEKVPMPDNPNITISYEHLIRLESRAIRYYLPDGAEKEYDVQELLGNVKPQLKAEEEILQLLREIKDQNDTQESLLEKANETIMLQPNFFGLGINLNELIKKIFKS